MSLCVRVKHVKARAAPERFPTFWNLIVFRTTYVTLDFVLLFSILMYV